MARGTKSPSTPHHRVHIPCEDMLDIPMAVEEDGDGANSCPVEKSPWSSDLAGLLQSKSTQQKHATSN